MAREPEAFSALWARMSRDPVLFLNTLSPKKPHAGQVRWLTHANQHINVLVPGNRWGKSTVMAMRHIWHNVFKVGMSADDRRNREPYETISVAMSADQAEIVFKEAKRLLAAPALKPLVRQTYVTPFPRIEFVNGAVMHCRSAHDDGKFVDGHRYSFLSVDEAGWIGNLRHLMNGVLLMRLAGGGMIDLIGTPKGYNDLYFYAERGMRGVDGYYTQRGSIYDNPFLPEADIRVRDRLLASADPKVREQVLFGDFVDFSGLAFTRDQRDNAFDPALPHEVPYRDGHRYVAAWDLGRQTDYTVGIVLDVTVRPWQLVRYVRLNRVAWEEIYATIGRVAKEYRVRWSTIDATGPGGDVIEEELTKRGVNVDGYKSSTKSLKVDLINTLQNALDEGRGSVGEREEQDESGNRFRVPVLQAPGEGWGALRLPMIVQLMDEMGVYQLDDKDLAFTDSVMALALAVHAAYEIEGVGDPVIGGLYGNLEPDLALVRESVDAAARRLGVDEVL